jgi:predicted Holliday junction resolvase-like endonuclease
MSRGVQAGINRWRNEKRQALETELKQLADADARMQVERWKQEHEKQIRVDAIHRSLAVTKGKVTEHIVPYLPGFDLDPKDIRFLGTPIDLIAFKGLNASVEEVEIVFIEVKTGRSVLSAREKAVKKAVEGKKVSWRVFNPDVEVIRPVIPNVTDGSSIRCNRDYKKQMRASVTYESRKLLLRQLESAN